MCRGSRTVARQRAVPAADETIVTREDAKAAGLKRYFTGVPCPSGHVAFRTTINGSCFECTRLAKAQEYAADPAPARRRAREWALSNPEKARLQAVRFRQTNPTAARAAQRKYRATVVDQIREANREWWQSNPEKVKSYNGRRRARRLGQLCNCCTAADFEAVYSQARPWRDEVDHVVPLAAGGKHCTKNLQVLTVEQHKEKTRSDRDVIARYVRLLKQSMWLDESVAA